jgi:hypothetical protein
MESRIKVFMYVLIVGSFSAGLLTGAFVVYNVVPDRIEVKVEVPCEECPEPECANTTYREDGCIALCQGQGGVGWFARDDSYAYLCQCVDGPEAPARHLREMW